MKTLKLAMMAGCLAFVPSVASAQGIPVHDNASLLQQIEQVRQAIQMIQQGQQQIDEAKKLYNDLNRLTDMSNIAQELRSVATNTLQTNTANIGGFTSGNMDVVGQGRQAAQQVYDDLMQQLGTNTTPAARVAYQRNAANASINAGIASSVAQSVDARQRGLNTLLQRLSTASSAKEVQDLQARVAIEQAAIQNDGLRLEAIQIQNTSAAQAAAVRYSAEQRRQAEARRAAVRRGN